MKQTLLRRNQEFYSIYQSDRGAEQIKKCVTLIQQSYRLRQLNLESPADLHIFDSPGISGFYVNAGKTLTTLNLRLTQEFLKDNLCSHGYFVSLADSRWEEKDFGTKLVERYYLKPNISMIPHQKMDQKFGNITLELHILNEKADYLKLMANVYNDHLYTLPRSFDELMDVLFE